MNKTAWFGIDGITGNLVALGVADAKGNGIATLVDANEAKENTFIIATFNIDSLYKLKAQIVNALDHLNNEALSG